MKLEHLDIQLLPGLDSPISASFRQDSINFITGPNASGKSSMVRAVRAVLFPEQMAEACHVRTTWRLGERKLDAIRNGLTVVWSDGGRTIPPPPLPGVENAGAYLISSEDLSQLGQTEAHIADRIRTLLAGGYDLDVLLSSSPFRRPALPRALGSELAELDRQVKHKLDEYDQLRQEMDRLASMEHELAEIERAAGELAACDDAIALADAIADRNALEGTLIREFPPGMDRLHGDELQRLTLVDDRIREYQAELEQSRRRLEETRQQINHSLASDPHALESAQAQLADQRNELFDLEKRIQTHALALEQVVEERRRIAQLLGGPGAEERPELPVEQLSEFEQLVDRVLDERENLRAIGTELARLHVPQTEDASTVETLTESHAALQQWLSLARSGPLEGLLWGLLTLVAITAGWRLLGPRALPPVAELILLLVIAAGIPAGLLGRFFLRRRELGRSYRRFLATGVEEPLAWSLDEVETRLTRLQSELETVRLRQIRHSQAAALRERMNSQRGRLEAAQERLARAAEPLGLAPEIRLNRAFSLWIRQLHDWQQADRKLATLRKTLEQDHTVLVGLHKRVNQMLEKHGLEPLERPSSQLLSAAIHRLTPRIRTSTRLHNDLHGLEQRLQEIGLELERHKHQRAQIFRQAGLEHDDLETLNERIRQRPRWQALEQEHRTHSMEVRRLEERLESEPELLKLARGQQREPLLSQRELLAERSARRDELNRQIASLRTRHEDLLQRRELQRLSQQRAQVRSALEEEFDQHMLAAAGQALIEDVRIAHQTDNEPLALERAGHWLEKFTRHRYQLQFNGGQFVALDTRQDQKRKLTELSTATRAQLLLAVRLAWMEQIEEGRAPLPVFMDEVLTTSDPDRYHQVVEATGDLIAAGRQMFYLTAQEGEAQAWQRDGRSVHVISTLKARRDPVEPLQYSMPLMPVRSETSLPDPAGLTPLQWAAEAEIPAIQPWQGIGQVAVFHLLHDDLPLVARLMQLELSRLGELGSFLERNEDSALLDSEQRELLATRIRAAELILRDWCERHHRPVDADALAASGAITETFMPRVSELAAELHGHPEALLAALQDGQVSRFRKDSMENLEDWLSAQGYLASRSGEEEIPVARLVEHSGLTPTQAAALRQWILAAIHDPLTAAGPQ